MKINYAYIKGEIEQEKVTIAYELTGINKPIDKLIKKHKSRLWQLIDLRPMQISEIILKERLV